MRYSYIILILILLKIIICPAYASDEYGDKNITKRWRALKISIDFYTAINKEIIETVNKFQSSDLSKLKKLINYLTYHEKYIQKEMITSPEDQSYDDNFQELLYKYQKFKEEFGKDEMSKGLEQIIKGKEKSLSGIKERASGYRSDLKVAKGSDGSINAGLDKIKEEKKSEDNNSFYKASEDYPDTLPDDSVTYGGIYLLPSREKVSDGQSLVLDIKYDGRDVFSGCAFSLVYPPNILEFEKKGDCFLPSLNYSDEADHSVFTINLDEANNGIIRMSGVYLDKIDGGGYYIGKPLTLFRFYFRVREVAETRSIKFELQQTKLFNPSAGYGYEGVTVLIKSNPIYSEEWYTPTLSDNFETLIDSFPENPTTTITLTGPDISEKYREF